MLRRVALVRTNVSEELSASFIRVTRINELGTTLAVTSNRRPFLQEPHGITSQQTPFFIYDLIYSEATFRCTELKTNYTRLNAVLVAGSVHKAAIERNGTGSASAHPIWML
jgi:hypothetical protein